MYGILHSTYIRSIECFRTRNYLSLLYRNSVRTNACQRWKDGRRTLEQITRSLLVVVVNRNRRDIWRYKARERESPDNY